MIKELVYLFILFIAGFLVLQTFYSFYNSAGKIIANQIENITNNNVVYPVNYVINENNFNGYSMLYLVQNNQNISCIKNIEVNDLPVNFSYREINQYTLEINVSTNVYAGDNVTIEYCNGQSYVYLIS